jgi:hypothetical protein
MKLVMMQSPLPPVISSLSGPSIFLTTLFSIRLTPHIMNWLTNHVTFHRIQLPRNAIHYVTLPSLEKKLEETKITESGSLDMNKMWNNVKGRIIAAGEEVMGTTQNKSVEWFDEECTEKEHGVAVRNISNYAKMLTRSAKK